MAARHFLQDKHETTLESRKKRVCLIDKIPPIGLGTMRKIHAFRRSTTCETGTNILEHGLIEGMGLP